MRTDPAADPRRRNLVTFLSGRSGFYTAEAVGVLAMKLLCAVIAVLLVPALFEVLADGISSAIVLGSTVALSIVAFTATALLAWTDLVVDRLRPSHRFHRLRRSRGAARSDRHDASDADQASAPSGSRRGLTIALAVLSLPALFVLAHILSAYASLVIYGMSFQWMAWEYSGFAVEPLLAVTNRWPLVVLTVLALSLLSLLLLLARGIGAAVRRLRTGSRDRRGAGTAPESPPDLPEGVLRSSPTGHGGTFLTAAVFLLLGLPSIGIVGYVLLAYLQGLWRFFVRPGLHYWDWSAPSHFSAFGQWYFQGDALTIRLLVPTLSGIALIAGISLATLAVPLLTRRGVEAIDLAVTESGVLTRGALALDWDDIAEVLVVDDQRVSSHVEDRPYSTPRLSRAAPRTPRIPPIVVNLTFTAAHSRTRVALVLHDLPGVAARATAAQRQGLHVDHDGTYGYALCDLWVHPATEVRASLEQLAAGAEAAQVPVTGLLRTATPMTSQMIPRWITRLWARR